MPSPDRSPDDRTIDLGIAGYTEAVEIGRGGFGVVYRAQQPDFNRTVAIKLLLGGRLDEQSRRRFDRERRIMGALSDHPNIVTVFGWGFTPGDNPYIAMAYMARGSLADLLERKGPLGWQEAARMGVKLCGALEAAHQAKVLHRDLKPENVLVSAYGEPTLADFGIARVEGGIETVGGGVTASVAHAAPEILSGQRPTVASDVYGLASTLLSLILGHPPFLGEHDESIVAMMARIGSDPVPDVRPHGVPDAVCRAIERAMSKSPERRPSSAAHFGHELQQALDRAGQANPRQTIVAASRVPRAPGTPSAPSAPPRVGSGIVSSSHKEAGKNGESAGGRRPSAPRTPERGEDRPSRITKEPARHRPVPAPAVPPPAPPAPQPAGHNSRKGIAIVVVIVVIALIAVGAVVLL